MDLDMGLPDPRGEVIRLPLTWVCFPLELRPPADFRPEEPRTWPKAHGRLENTGDEHPELPGLSPPVERFFAQL